MHRLSMASLACCAALGFGSMASAARAADNDITTSISGYGTVEGTMTGNSKYTYHDSLQDFKGANNQLDIGGQSRFGLQGNVNLGSQFSVTAQALASRIGTEDFDINTEWLFGQYEPITGLDFRLGRVVLPTFLFSDTRNVGYAQTWLRAPNEVYSLMPFKTLDGAQAIWRTSAGSVNLTSQLSYGKTSASIDLPTVGIKDTNAQNVISLAFVAEYGDWTARISQSRFDIPTTSPIGTHAAFTLDDKFSSAGIQYDNGTAIVLGEVARRSENKVPGTTIMLAETTSWYVAAGWRFDKLTPMIRYSTIKSVTGTFAYYKTQPTIGLALRYEAYHNVDLKLQIDRFDSHNSSAFITPDRGATPITKVNVLSAGADFVF